MEKHIRMNFTKPRFFFCRANWADFNAETRNTCFFNIKNKNKNVKKDKTVI